MWEDYFERNNETYIEVSESHRRTDSLEIQQQHSIEKEASNNTISTNIIEDKSTTKSGDVIDLIQNTFKVSVIQLLEVSDCIKETNCH